MLAGGCGLCDAGAMAGSAPTSFTHDYQVQGDRTVAFSCSRDAGAWPWLTLDPRHPIVLLTAMYWASVDCSRALGARDESKWSALTYAKWDCDAAPCGAMARGVYRNTSTEDALTFTLEFFDDQGISITRFEGRGVIFRTRNFEGWRSKSKPKPREALSPEGFTYASDSTLGLGPGECAFLAPLDAGEMPSARGLITAENGMPPGNPFLSGSGDHVNATHLAEVGRQFVSLLRNGEPFAIAQGEISFDHFVELGVPFEVQSRASEKGDAAMIVEQGGNACTAIEISVR